MRSHYSLTYRPVGISAPDSGSPLPRLNLEREYAVPFAEARERLMTWPATPSAARSASSWSASRSAGAFCLSTPSPSPPALSGRP